MNELEYGIIISGTEGNLNQRDSFHSLEQSTPIITYKKKKKKTGFGKKLMAAVLVAAVGGASLGVGLGFTRLYNVPAEQTSPLLNDLDSAVQETFTFAKADNASNIIQLTNKTSGVVSIVRAVSNAVVSINVTATAQDFFNRNFDQTGSGSGIIFTETADKVFIVTNNHVIANAKKVTISIDDTNEVNASFVGSDSESDLAVISVLKTDLQNAGIQHKLASFGNSDELEVGEAVVAIGNALGEGKTATLGIISAKNKKVTIDGKNLVVIQTDAAINPGNSGGALVDENGDVIGINTAKLSSSSIEGTGYSIPSNTVKKVVENLMQNGSVKKPYLGIQGFDITDEIKQAYNLPTNGVFIQRIIADSSAQAAGLVATDIIVGYGSEKISKMEELTKCIAKTKVGDTVKISIYRNGTTPLEINVVIKNMNADPSF